MQSVHGFTRKCLLCANLLQKRALEIQTDPTPYARVDSIGSDNPLCLRDLFTKDSAFTDKP